MAAITSPRSSTTFYGYPVGVPQFVNFSTAQPSGSASQLVGLPIAASTKIIGTGMVALNASGQLVNATATAGLTTIGIAYETVDNTAGIAGALQCPVVGGTQAFPMANSAGADAITSANVGAYCYVVDNASVALTSAGGTRPIAGRIKSVDSTYGVWVEFSIPAATGTNPAAVSLTNQARNVVLANVASLSSFTVAGNDGVTNVAGDIVLLVAQTTASQNGLYVVGTVTTGTAPLTRPAGYATGATALNGMLVEVSEGTRYSSSDWKMTTTGAVVIDTTSTAWYPRVEKGASAAMSAGAVTTSALFIRTGAGVGYNRLAGAGTLGNLSLVITAGQGSGSLAFTSSSGTETSTMTYVAANW